MRVLSQLSDACNRVWNIQQITIGLAVPQRLGIDTISVNVGIHNNASVLDQYIVVATAMA